MNGTDVSPGDDTRFLGTAIDKLKAEGGIQNQEEVCPYDAIILNAPDDALPKMRDSFCKRYRERWPGGDVASDIRAWLLQKSREQWRAEKLAESVDLSLPPDLGISTDIYLVREEDEVQRRAVLTTQHQNDHCTDYGNSDRFINRHGLNTKYCSAFDAWFIWTPKEGRWKRDTVSMIQELAKETVRGIFDEANRLPDGDKKQTDLIKWAFECETTSHTNAILKLSQSDPWVVATPEMFDVDPLKINMANCVYNLGTHQPEPHSKQQLITKTTGIQYDPAAKCPIWLKFLNRIFQGHPDKDEVIRFIQRGLGYSLTGKTNEQVLFLLYGQGQNGKSVLLGTFIALLGEYAHTADSSSFTTARSERVRDDLAGWVGKRLIKSSEVTKTAVLDEELIKKLTGEDAITARHLYEKEITYTPTYKLWLAFNHKPEIRDATFSMWRRVLLVPFTEIIPEKEQDKKLAENLIAHELPGIFNWAIEGLKEYQTLGGLCPPESVKVATQQYRQDSDVFYDFYNEICIIDNPNNKIRAGELYDAYRKWCSFNHELDKNVRSMQKFGRIVEERFKKVRDTKGVIYYGITINPEKMGAIRDKIDEPRYGPST